MNTTNLKWSTFSIIIITIITALSGSLLEKLKLEKQLLKTACLIPIN
jgi:hypothetical protein